MTTAQSSGRRTESLFDNRYRYDHIYPRGRSGETLRAYDTHDHDHPVVVKRPAPQDAPPMRAGQEVSIRNEKQALERLSGHPMLTELRGSGEFRVGGHTHEYIVIDLAPGVVVESMVLEQAEQNAYLPELEVLVIVDGLLDLLIHAHENRVIYNDVDAKHLFWDRTTYRLKVIDWGNAVFMDEPRALPTNVNQATDIYQCGELLYFILTGGNRLVTELDDSETFFVNFGQDAERIPARLQGIVARAVEPDPKRRFGTVRDLRAALAEYRQPLERERDEIVGRVGKRVRATASQEELEELRAVLQQALVMDPGYPEARQLGDEIERLLRQIAVQADLDATRIYLESANWPRALSLLDDLLPLADGQNEQLVRFLMAGAATLEQMRVSPPPNGFLQALDPLFGGDVQTAGQVLLTTHEARPTQREAQWLLAEQLSATVPDVVLLRPHLVRLRHELGRDGRAADAVDLLNAVEQQLERTPVPGLTGLLVIYQQVADMLARLEERVETVVDGDAGDESETVLAAAIRARRAAQDVVARLEQVSAHAFGDPTQAGDYLRRASAIDPTSPHFVALHSYFDEVHQAVDALGQFRPRSNGANLAAWFDDVQEFLEPYLTDLSDPRLHDAAAVMRTAAEGWTTILNYFALGRRQPTIDLLRRMADGIRPLNENLAAWFSTLANRLPEAAHVEKLSPHEALGDLLVTGWQAWDRGDGLHVQQMADDVQQAATTDGERLAGTRLSRLGALLESWHSEGGSSAERLERAEVEALSILLADEERERRTFAEQMPNTSLYLRAMNRGIVSFMHSSSSAGWRALYLHYVLRGMLALHDGDLDDAEFWREAASNTFDSARTHRAYQVLDRALTIRRLTQGVERAMSGVSEPRDLEQVRQALNAPLASDVLSGAQQAIQSIQQALGDWSDGDFFAARQAFDQALDNLQATADTAGLRIEPFLAWVTNLRDTAAELQQTRLSIEQGAHATSETPDPALREAHMSIVERTLNTVGPEYAHQVRQWQDMYLSVLDTYTTQRLTRSEKLAAFNRHFASLFITKHPLYPLFRHWESVVEQLPPDVDEDAVIDVDGVASDAPDPNAPVYVDEDVGVIDAADAEPERGGELSWNWIIVGAVVLLLAGAVFAVTRVLDGGDDASGSSGDGASDTASAGAAPTADPFAGLPPAPSESPVPPTQTPLPTEITPSTTPTTPPTTSPTESPTVLPSITPTTVTTSATPPPTDAPAPTATAAVAAAPTPGGDGTLAALAAAPAELRTWPEAALRAADGAWQLNTAEAGGELVLVLTPDLMTQLFAPGAASAFISAEATLELVDYDPAALAEGAITLGLGAENQRDQRTLGQVQFVGENFISVGMNQNGTFSSPTQFPLQNPVLRLGVRRTNANTLSFYLDDRSLGDSVFLFPRGEPISLVLSVTGADVVVRLDGFEVEFRARDELP